MNTGCAKVVVVMVWSVSSEGGVVQVGTPLLGGGHQGPQGEGGVSVDPPHLPEATHRQGQQGAAWTWWCSVVERPDPPVMR